MKDKTKDDQTFDNSKLDVNSIFDWQHPLNWKSFDNIDS